MRCHLSGEKTNIREGNDILRLFLRFHGLIEISYGRVSSIHFPTFNGMLNLQFEQRGLVDQVGHTQCFDWHPRCFLPNCATACVCVDRVVGGGGGNWQLVPDQVDYDVCGSSTPTTDLPPHWSSFCRFLRRRRHLFMINRYIHFLLGENLVPK